MRSVDQCDLCQSKDFDRRATIVCSAPDRTVETFSLLCCRRCTLLQLDPLLEPHELERWYPEDYGAYLPAGSLPTFASKIRYFLRRPWALPLALYTKPLQRRATLPRGGRLLDVGCGSGAFLLGMKAKDFEVVGVEPHPQACARAKASGLEVFCGTVEGVTFSPAGFDSITLHHVLEHVPSPLRTLKRCRELLKPNGVIVITTPNERSLAHRLFRTRWLNLDPPRHTFLFSPRTIRAYAERVGLRIRRLRFVAHPAGFLGSLDRVFGTSRLEGNPLLNLLFIPLTFFTNVFHQGDVFEVELVTI